MGSRWLVVVVLLPLVLLGCDEEDEEPVVLPEDPCALVRRADVAAAVDAEVTEVKREPSIDQIVEAQERGGDAADVPLREQRLCSYTTTSGFGAITVFVPAPSADGAALFESRRSDTESAQGIGDDAYFSGAGLSILVNGQMFSLQVQNPVGRDIRPALRELAERTVSGLAS